ncbi:MAG: hypothetical protein KW788_04525 [Candidatus Doudnabacteria bacterium]|nr:hypothetical protein [Candidatus Doudnabacteria bacterium]
MPTLKFLYDSYEWYAEISREGQSIKVKELCDDRGRLVPLNSPLGQKLGRYILNATKPPHGVLVKAAQDCCNCSVTTEE